MKLLISTSNKDYNLYIVDTDKESIVREISRDSAGDNKNADNTRNIHRPFGITWNKDKLFVGNRRNLLVYDKEWNLENVVHDVLDENTHQITWWKDRIISCMTRKDCIQIMKEDGSEPEFFHPLKGWVENPPTLGDMKLLNPSKREKHHINAVNVVNDILYILMAGTSIHTQIPGYSKSDNRYKPVYGGVVMLDLNTKEVKHRIPYDTTAVHGLYVENEDISVIKTKFHHVEWKDKIVRYDNFKRAFMRGMAGDSHEIAIGGSKISQSRSSREFGDGKLFIINDEGVREFSVCGHSAINDIRRIDGVDYAHNNPYRFPLPY